jgi:hypothetical protein
MSRSTILSYACIAFAVLAFVAAAHVDGFQNFQNLRFKQRPAPTAPPATTTPVSRHPPANHANNVAPPEPWTPPPLSKRTVINKGRLTTRYLQTTELKILGSTSHVVGQFFSHDGVRANHLVAYNFSAKHAQVDRIGDGSKTLKLSGRIQVNGQIRYGTPPVPTGEVFDAENVGHDSSVGPSGATAFIEVMSVAGEGDVNVATGEGYQRQWHMIHHSDFAEQHAQGWSWSDGSDAAKHVSDCGNGDYFLHATCTPSSNAESDKPDFQGLVRKFDNLPDHERLQLTARVHFIDAWHGAAAFASIDGETIWVDTHGDADPDAHSNGIDMCGQTHLTHDRLSVPVSVTIPHSGPVAEIAFGSTIAAHAPNACHASMGIDDVSISIM